AFRRKQQYYGEGQGHACAARHHCRHRCESSAAVACSSCRGDERGGPSAGWHADDDQRPRFQPSQAASVDQRG
ncbi:unnamed protein product, partial [Closterium sp. NIES-53]